MQTLHPDNIPAFWQNRWLTAETGWDLRQASPPLTEYAAQIPPERRNLSVLIPGCGSGHEADFLLENGFSSVTMLDIAPAAVEKMRERFHAKLETQNPKLSIRCGDFFEHEGQYDLILEQTFFCALPPALRPDYVKKMHTIIRPDGKLVGVLFDREFPGGPPFGGSRAEYEALFEPYFDLKIMEACHNSVPPRAGTEVFFVAQRRVI